MKLGSLADVFEAELQDLYSAEKQLVEALPTVASAASSTQLSKAIEQHLEETRGHVKRLEESFKAAGLQAKSEHCDGMAGLIEEGSEIAQAQGDGRARDAALIGAAQRVEHYEIAAYGTARTLAKQLGHHHAADLLSQTLHEESNANEKLTAIATTTVNATAATPRRRGTSTTRANAREVRPASDGGWDVIKPGGRRRSAHFAKQSDAAHRARQILANTGGGELRIASKTGEIRKADTIPPLHDPRKSKG